MKEYIKVGDGNVISGSVEVRDIASWDEVARNNDGSYSLREYVDIAPAYNPASQRINKTGYVFTATDVTTVYEIVPLTTAEIALNTFNAQIEAGYDTGLGFRLFLHFDDRTILTSMQASISLALSLGQMQLTDMVSFSGMDGKEHPVTVQTCLGVLLGYAMYFTTIRAAYKAAITSVVP